MARHDRSPTRTRRFIIVIALCSLAAGGLSLAADPATFSTNLNGREITGPGGGSRYDFYDRVSEILDRMNRLLGVNPTTRLIGGQQESCFVCPDPPRVVDDRPLPDPRPNTHRPENRGTRSGSERWFLPR